MQDKSEIADFARTLEPGIWSTFLTAAMLGAPAQHQHISIDRRPAHLVGCWRFQSGPEQEFWGLALPRLRH